MNIDVVLRPQDLRPDHTAGRAVVVFDVLRATTSITAALAAGVGEIHVFPDLAAASRAAASHGGPRLLCGEANCLPPPGFDLGNSPGAFTRAAHGGRVAFMSTTNGTRAILSAAGAAVRFAGALVNAAAAARALAATGRDVTLLCAGTNGEVAMEDVLGAGAVLEALSRLPLPEPLRLSTDTAAIARRLFDAARNDLRGPLAESRGGQNVIAAGLEGDVDFCARLDAFDLVGVVEGGAEPVVRPWAAA